MTVSIIVAAYNVEKYIERCLISLINQSYRDIEIIVVDDCSTDNTKDLCRNFERDDNRIVIVEKKENQGLSEARNTGIEVASGEYITFIDGDDFIDSYTIEKCVNILEKTSADELVFSSSFDRKDGSSYIMPINSSKHVYVDDEVMDRYYKEALGSMPDDKNDRAIGITPWARIYKTDIIKKNKLYFISERKLIYEDLMFFLTVTPYIKSVLILNKPFYHYCENEGSLTQRYDLERFNKVKKMYYYIKEHFKTEIFEDTEALLRFQRLMISYIRLSVMQLGKDNKNKSLIINICKDDFTREVIRSYPYGKLPLKQRVFFLLLKYKNGYLLHLLCKYYKG